MDINLLAIFGILSAVINFVAFSFYIKSIVRGETKPERSAWWIWTVLMIVALFAQAAAGATWSLLLTAAFLVGNVTIGFLSIKYGHGNWGRANTYTMFLCGLGVVAWIVTEDPLAALLVVIAINFLGNWLTAVKTWRKPKSESLIAWIFLSLGALAGLLAVGSTDLARVIFPLYVTIGNFAIFGIIYFRRNSKKHAARKQSRRKTRK